MAAIGDPVPALDHAVSVSLPSWDSTVGYEEGAEWVTTKMKNGYPRFLIHFEIQALADSIVARYGHAEQMAMLFPSLAIAKQCLDFLQRKNCIIGNKYEQILELHVQNPRFQEANVAVMVFAVMLDESSWKVALKFWQHTGEGISSRRARFLQEALDDDRLKPRLGCKTTNGNRDADGRSQPELSETKVDDSRAKEAKSIIKARVSGNFDAFEKADSAHEEGVRKISEDDVFLYPTGMSAIFNVHQVLMKARGPLRSIMFGFPYIDTLKILESFGPGCDFFGQSSDTELDEIEARCQEGERFLALFCEFPGNPLLKTPDLQRIKQLADRFDFAVVIDDTIGNFLNVNVLPAADAVVSSLTKVFSGASNVMGGSCVLNPQGRYHNALRRTFGAEYHDHYWPEDAVVMEQNSRDFVERNKLINENTQKICGRLKMSPVVRDIFYPSIGPTKSHYDAYRTPHGGYGGLLSLTFYCAEDARCFFDNLSVAKGPSLGTNFTLASPYVILAHYHELDWAASYGVPVDLIRVSIGAEEYSDVLDAFEAALEAVQKSETKYKELSGQSERIGHDNSLGTSDRLGLRSRISIP